MTARRGLYDLICTTLRKKSDKNKERMREALVSSRKKKIVPTVTFAAFGSSTQGKLDPSSSPSIVHSPHSPSGPHRTRRSSTGSRCAFAFEQEQAGHLSCCSNHQRLLNKHLRHVLSRPYVGAFAGNTERVQLGRIRQQPMRVIPDGCL